MEQTNPYQPIGQSDSADQVVDPTVSQKPVSKIVMAIWLLAFCFPLLSILSMYGCWLVAWMTLGHPPRPMINDPKYIGGAMTPAYFVSNMLLMALPGSFIIRITRMSLVE